MPEDLMPQMREAIEAALSGSQVMGQREFAEREAEGRKIAAHAAVKPSFRSSLAARQEDDQNKVDRSGFESRVIYNVSLSQPIYHWGALRAEKRIGDLQYEMEQLNTKASASSVVARVRREYMALVISKQRWKRSQINLEQDREKHDFQQEQIDAGSAGVASILPFRVAKQRSELSELKAKIDWQNKLEDFSVFTTLDPRRVEEILVDEIPAFELDENETSVRYDGLIDEGVERSEDLAKLDLDLRIEQERLRITSKSLRPKINADLGLSSNALDVDGTRREQSFSYFGLSVSWSIFDGFRNKGRKLEVLNRLSRKEMDRVLAEEAIARGLKRLAVRLEVESRSLAIEEYSLRMAQANLNWVRESVEAELASLAELKKSEGDYDAALLRTQESRISYLMALSDLAAELGLDTSTDQ